MVVRIPSKVSRSELQFNITPLIDVVFLLIIFFLVASHFARSE
ncbi:MAG: biopolymer transporter ExbD, partial [Planctomycetaceae bacterium]|nr:biopolymer transporter ExbD [Planctomycetaceae bacterium]